MERKRKEEKNYIVLGGDLDSFIEIRPFFLVI